MTNRIERAFRMTALAAAVLSACGPALAEGEQNWLSIGVGNWSNDRPQRGIYDGMRNDGLYGLVDADVVKRDNATGNSIGLKVRGLGLDNREVRGEWQRQGDIGASFEYSRIPRDQPWTYNTGVQGIGSARLLVPTPSIVPGRGTNYELGTHRDRFTGTFFKTIAPGFNFNLSFRNEDKEGTRGWGRGGAPEFAVEPIDSTIRILDATLNYARDKLQLSGGLHGTSYENKHKLIITSLTSLAPASFFNLSQPLDSKSWELFLNGGYNFTPTTRGTFKASFARAWVDEDIPTSTTPGLIFPAGQAPHPSTPRRLDAHINTTMLELGLTSRPLPQLNVAANLRYRDFNDKTPLMGIVFNAAGTPTVYNTPFSYTNTTGKLEATYRLPHGYNVMGGVEYKHQDRQVPTVGTLWVPFRADLEEMTWQAQLRKSMAERLNGSIGYLYGDRDGGAYTLPRAPGEPEQDAINPFNISDRKRHRVRAMVDWSPVDRLNLQLAMEEARDRYSGLPYGLQKGRGRLYSIDGSYQVNAAWQVHAWYSRDENQANELTQQAATVFKHNDLREVGNSFGIGVRGDLLARLKVGANAEYFHSVNEYRQAVVGGVFPPPPAAGVTLVPLPDIKNKLLRLKLFATYAARKNADIAFQLIHERYRTDDWTWLMFPPGGPVPFAYGTTTDGTTVLTQPEQNSTFVGIRYIFRFQ